MTFRKILLRTLLWSLAVAAVCGAVAVLAGDTRSTWRIMATALITAGACVLMFGAARLVDWPVGRPAGLVGMTAIVIEYFLLLALVWVDVSERTALTAAFIGGAALPVIGGLVMARMTASRLAGVLLCAGSAVVCLMLLCGVWLHNRPWDDDFWYSLGGAIATFLPVAVLCLVGAGTDRRHWRWLGVIASGVASAGLYQGIVGAPDGSEALFTTVVCVALAVAHANVVMLIPLLPGQRWVRAVTLVGAAATALFIDVAVLTEHGNFAWSRVAERWAGAAAIVAGCGSLALLVLARINRRVRRPVVAVETITAVTLVCPACAKRQTLPAGDSRCESCNLLISTRFAEPRCEQCDYSLFMLKSDRCPECGTAVRGVMAASAGG